MNKFVEKGKVAVIISPQFGAGWYTWNNYNENLLFDPILVKLVGVLHNHKIDTKEYQDIAERIVKRAEEIEPDGYFSVSGLSIVWLPVGTKFIIEEYDGSESILEMNDTQWMTA